MTDKNLFYEKTSFFTSDEEQIKFVLLPKDTNTNSNKKTSKNIEFNYGNIPNCDEIESKGEDYHPFILNNSFIINNVDMLNINSPFELNEISFEDIIPNSFCKTLTKSTNFKNPLEIEIQKENPMSSVCITLEERKDIFINRKKERDGKKYRFIRRDNVRRTVARFFFNHFLKNMIEKMKKECNCILYLNYFPKKFIFQAEKKRNKHFLDYTFEQLLENKDLYENKDIRNYYTINKKVIDELKSEKNKNIMANKGYDKILKMTYRNLFQKFLNSDEYKNHYEELIKIKGETEAEKFKYFSETFIEEYKN